VVPVVGSGGDCVWRESGVRRSVLCWCIWQEPVTCYKFCTFSATCKDNAAINCITVQHKKKLSSFHHLTRPIAREDFIDLVRRESFRSHKKKVHPRQP
jgi:hypothetical protein